MAVVITDERMTSDLTRHLAQQMDMTIPKGDGLWRVSWLPDRPITRNEAITAMTLAELVTEDADRHAWSSYAAELGMTVDEVVERITHEHDQGKLPTFQDMRRRAYGLLGDAQDELRSDWRDGTGPSPEQADALRRARRALADAKEALNEAAN